MTRHALGFAIGLALASATATASPQVPTPANPYPDEPISTDGTPLRPTYGVRARDDFNAFSSEENPLRNRRRR